MNKETLPQTPDHKYHKNLQWVMAYSLAFSHFVVYVDLNLFAEIEHVCNLVQDIETVYLHWLISKNQVENVPGL